MTKFYVAGHALIERDAEYLVTRRSPKNDYMPLKWDIPGGTVEPSETVEDALKREVAEETGVTVSVGRVLYIYTNLSQLPVRQTFQTVYLCHYLEGEVMLDPEEHDQYIWLRKDQMYDIDAIAFLRAFIHSKEFDI
jgi:8-oxo-dGTP diphosphatase